jgi:hypothetical protein
MLEVIILRYLPIQSTLVLCYFIEKWLLLFTLDDSDLFHKASHSLILFLQVHLCSEMSRLEPSCG